MSDPVFIILVLIAFGFGYLFGRQPSKPVRFA